MRGHILLSELQLVATKGCKNAAGVPPDPKESCRFSFQENLPGRIKKPTIYIRGPEAPGSLGAHNIMGL